MSEFDKIMADTQEKIEFHTEQYNTPTYEDEVHTHTSGGTYFGDSISNEVSILSSEDVQGNVVVDSTNTPTTEVSSFDYFIFFGLIIMVVILLINKIRSKKQ